MNQNVVDHQKAFAYLLKKHKELQAKYLKEFGSGKQVTRIDTLEKSNELLKLWLSEMEEDNKIL